MSCVQGCFRRVRQMGSAFRCLLLVCCLHNLGSNDALFRFSGQGETALYIKSVFFVLNNLSFILMIVNNNFAYT